MYVQVGLQEPPFLYSCKTQEQECLAMEVVLSRQVGYKAFMFKGKCQKNVLKSLRNMYETPCKYVCYITGLISSSPDEMITMAIFTYVERQTI